MKEVFSIHNISLWHFSSHESMTMQIRKLCEEKNDHTPKTNVYRLFLLNCELVDHTGKHVCYARDLQRRATLKKMAKQ